MARMLRAAPRLLPFLAWREQLTAASLRPDRLDAEVCRGCSARIFTECQRVLPEGSVRSDAA